MSMYYILPCITKKLLMKVKTNLSQEKVKTFESFGLKIRPIL